MRYEICWVGKDGLYGCGHEHPSVADATRYMAPNSGCFIRACESGVYRSLSEREFTQFLLALNERSWRSSAWSEEKDAGADHRSPPRFFESFASDLSPNLASDSPI